MNRGTPRVFFLVPGWASLVTFFVVAGCSRAPSSEPRAPEAPGPRDVVALPKVEPASSSTAKGLASPLPRDPDVHWSAGNVIEGTVARHLARGEVRRIEWRRLPGSEPAWLALDQHAARAFLGAALALNELLDEDQELAPGHHRLVAVRRDAVGFVVQHNDFWLETSEGVAPRSGCVILAAGGTFNGVSAASAISMLVLPLGAEVDRVRAVWEGPGEHQDGGLVSVEAGSALDFRPQARESGDFVLSLDCLDASEQSLEKLTRTFTVNRDAPVRGAGS